MSILKVVPEPIDAFKICQGLYGNTSIAGLRAGNSIVFNHSGTSLRIFEEAGSFVYDSLAALGPWEEWQGGSMQAGQLMQDYVLRTGGFPESIEFERRFVHKQGLFVTGYTFVYRQIFGGYPALGFGGLRVRLGNGNLVHMLRSLHNVNGELTEKHKIISARDAIQVAARNLHMAAEVKSSYFVLGVRLGYFTLWPEVKQTALEPVWEVKLKGQTIYVNALTTEIMLGDGCRYPGR